MPRTRDRLIEIAAELVDEGGEAAVTMRAVGSRAGLSHNVPYKHFTDKRDLLACVAAAELRTLAARIDAAAGAASGPDRAAAAAVAYLDWARARPARFKLVFGPWGTEPHDELGEAAGAATGALRSAVAAAIEDGSLTGDPDRTAAMIWALAHGGADLDLAGHLRKKPGAPSPEELVRDLLGRLGRER